MEIRLSKEEVERLNKKRSESEEELKSGKPFTSEGMAQRIETEKRLKQLQQNLRTIDEYLGRFGDAEPLHVDVVYRQNFSRPSQLKILTDFALSGQITAVKRLRNLALRSTQIFAYSKTSVNADVMPN